VKPLFFDSPEYKKRQSEIAKQKWQEGVYNFKRKQLLPRNCSNPNCKNIYFIKSLTSLKAQKRKYCSHKCAYQVRSPGPPKMCLQCGTQTKRKSYNYCSNRCQINYLYSQFINRWKEGLEDGNKGIKTKIISGHIRRYLKEKYGEKCSLCGWDKIHLTTKKVPLEVNHIDGNADNNKEENLQLLCPNCHSLTPNFRNLNKGNGRSWRKT
jgi:Zn finger protein HypA/HybF involved in hydrogenase expression